MHIERWLYRLLDLKAKAQEIFPKCKIELSINEPDEYGSPMVNLIVYTNQDVDEAMLAFEKLRDWWLNMPFKNEPFVLIHIDYID